MKSLKTGDRYTWLPDMLYLVQILLIRQLFEKFFRLDEARSTDNGGAGLGLAIAKDIVTLHGGRITAEASPRPHRRSYCLPVP